MRLWIRAELLRLTNIRASQNRRKGDPGPEGSIGKAAMAELNKDIYSAALDLLGAEGMLFGPYADGASRAGDEHWTRSRSRSCACAPTRSRAARPR